MNKEDVEKQVKGIIADKLELHVDDVKNESKLEDDLAADSLDCVEIVMELEKVFHVSINDDQLFEMNTWSVSQVCDMVWNLIEPNQ